MTQTTRSSWSHPNLSASVMRIFPFEIIHDHIRCSICDHGCHIEREKNSLRDYRPEQKK